MAQFADLSRRYMPKFLPPEPNRSRRSQYRLSQSQSNPFSFSKRPMTIAVLNALSIAVPAYLLSTSE